MEAESRPSDEELAEQARSGDRDAFAELWQRHAAAGRTAAWQFRTIADPDDVVSEAYLQIFRAMERGGGPREAFRPYLYRTIRNVALGWRTKTPSVSLDFAEELTDPAPDPEAATIRNTITVRAFRTLPERWQTVLWYTEVEGMEPAEAAPFLGLTANSAAALAYRAREGLKKAWLQAHVNDQRVPPECRWTTERMGDYVRGALTVRARVRFEQHLETCTRCQILLEEIDGLSGRLAAILLPLTLGGTAGAALLAHQLSGEAVATVASAVPGGRAEVLRPPRGPIAAAAALAIAAASVAGAFAIDGAFQPEPSVTVSEGETPSTPEPERPSPEPTASPTPPAPPPPPAAPPAPPERPRPPVVTPPVVPPVVPPVNPPDTAAPAAPAVAGPANGSLTNAATPTFTGTGEPGATVHVRSGDAVIATAVVAANGTWTATSTVTVPDGEQSFAITLTDPAGNRSPATTVTLIIDTVAPPAPTVASPADGALTNTATPTFTGTGEPGATVHVRNGDAVIATAVVAADGTWTATSTVTVPDGEQSFAITLTDPAGNVSPPTALSLTIDTVALPPTVDALPAGPMLYLPDITGTAEPGAQVELHGDGGLVATAQAAADGSWQIPLPDPGADGEAYTAVQVDPAGNRSAASISTGPLAFERPAITNYTLHPSPGGTIIEIEIDGIEGMRVRVLIDGQQTATTHTLGAAPITRVTPPLADGPHTIAVRYTDPDTGRTGSLATYHFDIGAAQP